MDAMENLLTRRSCRAYKDEPVSDDAIYNIVRAGLYAPSGMGRQSAIVVVVTDKAVRDQLSRMNAEIAGMKEGDPFYGAPSCSWCSPIERSRPMSRTARS